MLDKSYDGIIFDLDGTMWDTRKPICEAWNIILLVMKRFTEHQ